MSENLDQQIRKQSVPIVAWIFLIAFAGLYLANSKLNPQCSEGEQNSQSSWGITENSINAKLLWQKVNIPGLRIYGVANSNLAVSEKYVLIARDNVCDVCNSVTAFEVDSGETAWTSPFSLVHFLRAYDDVFYIIYGDIQVARTLASGKQSRLLTKLPPRSARILYPTDYNVFLPVGADTLPFLK